MAISWSDMLWLAATATGDARYRLGAAPLAEPLRARIDAQTVFNSWTRGRRIARTAANSSWGSYYLFESLLTLDGRVDPLRV